FDRGARGRARGQGLRARGCHSRGAEAARDRARGFARRRAVAPSRAGESQMSDRRRTRQRPRAAAPAAAVIHGRNAVLEAARAGGAIIPEHRSAPLSAAAVKATPGPSGWVSSARVSRIPSAIADVKRAGIWCDALDVRGETAPWDFDLTHPVCIVIGSEG